MLNITERDGLSWELVALLEVAAEEAGYSSPESFIIDAAVKEAGRVLAKAGDSDTTACDEVSIIGQELQPEDYQLDMFEDGE